MEFNLSFLEDEIRCGFYVPAIMKQLWAAQLEVLSDFDAICKKYGLRYFADWGTLLGTVRHQGFVPWDDDLDVSMIREDYDKLIQLYMDHPEEFEGKLTIFSYKNRDDYTFFHNIAMGKDHICFEKEHLEKYHGFPYVTGLDIYVLDHKSTDLEKQKKMAAEVKFIIAVADHLADGTWKDHQAIEANIKKIEETSIRKVKRLSDPIEQRRELYHLADEMMAQFTDEGSEELIQNVQWGLIHPEIKFLLRYYETQEYLPMEYFQMPVPNGYKEMLEFRYKDYRKIIKNRSAHEYPYFAKQKAEFEAQLDFELPHFEFDMHVVDTIKENREITKAESWKITAQEAVANLQKLQEQIVEDLSKDHLESLNQNTLLDALANAQQLAVDLGTFIEAVWGEKTVEQEVGLISTYCENIFAVYQQVSVLADGADAQEDLLESKEMSSGSFSHSLERFANLQGKILHELHVAFDEMVSGINKMLGRKEVVFIPVRENDWEAMTNYCKHVIENVSVEYKQQILINIMPIPYHHKSYDGGMIDTIFDRDVWNKKITEWKQGILSEVIKSCNGTNQDPSWIDIQLVSYDQYDMVLHHPDEVYTQFPYDNENPCMSVDAEFFSTELSYKTDKLIYVPWFQTDEFTKADGIDYLNMKYYCDLPGVFYVDEVELTSDDLKSLYFDRLVEIYTERFDEEKLKEMRSRLHEILHVEKL